MRVLIEGVPKKYRNAQLKAALEEAVGTALRDHLYVDPMNIGISFGGDASPDDKAAGLVLRVTGMGSVVDGHSKVAAVNDAVSKAVSSVAFRHGAPYGIMSCSTV